MRRLLLAAILMASTTSVMAMEGDVSTLLQKTYPEASSTLKNSPYALVLILGKLQSLETANEPIEQVLGRWRGFVVYEKPDGVATAKWNRVLSTLIEEAIAGRGLVIDVNAKSVIVPRRTKPSAAARDRLEAARRALDWLQDPVIDETNRPDQ